MIIDLLVHRVEPRTVAVSKIENPEVVFEVPLFETKWLSPPAPGAVVTAAVPEGPPIPVPRKATPKVQPLPKLLPPLSKAAKITKRKLHAEAFRERVLAADQITDPNLKGDIAKLSWRHWEAIRRAAIGSMDRASIEVQLLTARRVLEMLVSRKSLSANKMRNVAASYLRKMDTPPASLLPLSDEEPKP